MALSVEDYKYFDEKFRILACDYNERIGILHEKVNVVRDDLCTHVATPCPDTRAHIEQAHDPGKFWGTMVAIVAVSGTLIGGIIWLIQHA